MTFAPDTLALGRPFQAPAFEARALPAQKRALARLRWAVAAMVLLNVLVWGGMIATARGVIDVHRLVDEAQALAATWIAALPHVNVTITR